MPETYDRRRSWFRKFGDAGRGVVLACVGSSSFYVHGVVSLGLIGVGVALGLSRDEWLLITLCIGVVTSLEAMNSAVETLAPLIDRQENAELGKALDIASGAVLLGSISAAIIGTVVFVPKFLALLP